MRPPRRRKRPVLCQRALSGAGLVVLTAIGLGLLGAWGSRFPPPGSASARGGLGLPVRVEFPQSPVRERQANAQDFTSHKVVLAESPIVSGVATYYGVEDGYVDGTTYCGSAFSPMDVTTAAVRPGRYPCGTRLLVIEQASQHSIEVVVKDHCGGCGWNHLDLSRGAFSRLAPVARGRLDVVWVPFQK